MKQRLIVGVALLVAFAALIGAGIYSGERTPSAPVLSGSAADGGGERGSQEPEVLDVDPIQGWFPAAGEGSGCSEAVGVDLIPGYSAVLTINGQVIAENETNVYQNFEDRILSASGSQGMVTWGPEPDCPFGQVLRATDNTVVACVYRTIEGPTGCRTIARPDSFGF